MVHAEESKFSASKSALFLEEPKLTAVKSASSSQEPKPTASKSVTLKTDKVVAESRRQKIQNKGVENAYLKYSNGQRQVTYNEGRDESVFSSAF